MPFAMPRLVDVLSARYTQTGGLELHIIVTDYLGNPDAVTIPYTRDVTEERLPDGQYYELGLDIDAWLLAHPEFEIDEYVAPAPSPDPSDYPLSMLKLRLGLVRNGFPADFIPSAISTITDPLARAEAQIWYEETKDGIQWGHPMTQSLMAAAAASNPGFTEVAALMWLEAAGYAT